MVMGNLDRKSFIILEKRLERKSETEQRLKNHILLLLVSRVTLLIPSSFSADEQDDGKSESDEDFKIETKKKEIKETISTSQMRVKLSVLAQACDRTGVSDRNEAVFVKTALKDMGTLTKEESSKPIDRNKIRRARAYGVYFGGRKDRTLIKITEREGSKRKTIGSEPGFLSLRHVTPKSGTSLEIGKSIFNFLTHDADISKLQSVAQRKMPFSLKKMGIRREIPVDVIKRAIEEVSKVSKITPTAEKYGIPRSNLQRYLQRDEIKDCSRKFVSCQIFSCEEERKLADYLMTCSEFNYGKLGQKWYSFKRLREFLKRQPQLSVGTPKATSVSRATSFNKTKILKVYMKDMFGPEAYRAMPNTENKCFGQKPLTSTTTMPDTDYVVVEQNPSISAMNMSDADNAPIENASNLSRDISVESVGAYPKAGPRKDTKNKKKKEIIYSSSEDENENVSESEEFDEDDIINLDRSFETENFVAVKFDTKRTLVIVLVVLLT
ncbi:hypothetical protein ILUMI_18027 [Ignelater luminosus]|uniref:HTH psq-type domain-containing protein n=1 Tax=Ignelater luminosus TaxID=2038154 RepID=A0A8K0CNE8_IGNLU|nr:hypothetical protein ILUMI_18027 [Ignelater luminosus]